jgi:hypothetical protein
MAAALAVSALLLLGGLMSAFLQLFKTSTKAINAISDIILKGFVFFIKCVLVVIEYLLIHMPEQFIWWPKIYRLKTATRWRMGRMFEKIYRNSNNPVVA